MGFILMQIQNETLRKTFLKWIEIMISCLLPNLYKLFNSSFYLLLELWKEINLIRTGR
jgi:hypothetical protein